MSDVQLHDGQLVVDGWSVPLVTAVEGVGGKVLFLIDGRLGYESDAGDYERTAYFAADLVATCFGYGAHPRGDLSSEERERLFARVPHPSLAPHRVVEVMGVESTEEAA